MYKNKSVILDLDGTLLTSDKSISEKTKAALIRIQEQGVRVIIASGRPTSGVLPHALALKLDKYHGSIVSFNGAHTMDYTSLNTINETMIPVDDVKRLLKNLALFNVSTMIVRDSVMYVNDAYENLVDMGPDSIHTNIIEYEARSGNLQITEVKELAKYIDFPIYKVLIAGNPKYLQKHIDQIAGPFYTSMNCVFSAPFYFEFTAQGVDKAAALTELYHTIGLSLNQAYAFGDGHNDVSMLKLVGTSVAMGNAEQDVKDVADRVCKSNDEDGIAETLYQLFPELF